MWVLVGCALLVVLFFVLKKPAPPPPEPPVIAAATPVPATPVPATPAPVIVKATPTPAPVVIATPAPTPTPPTLDLATVARTPALWPPQVALLQPAAFPILLNGRAAGEVKVPAGTVLRLVRVSGQVVEVEYQAGKHVIAATSTDLMQRALVAFRNGGSVQPAKSQPVAAAPSQVAAPAATPPQAATAQGAGAVTFEQRVRAEVVRKRSNKIAGGDWDDKTDRIAFTVKLANADTAAGFSDCKGEFYIFAQNILNPKSYRLLSKEDFAFSLPPRGTHEFSTAEAVTQYDPTGARFGAKYEGWAMVIRDKSDKIIMKRGTPPAWLAAADKLKTLAVKSSYEHDLKPVSLPAGSR